MSWPLRKPVTGESRKTRPWGTNLKRAQRDTGQWGTMKDMAKQKPGSTHLKASQFMKKRQEDSKLKVNRGYTVNESVA